MGAAVIMSNTGISPRFLARVAFALCLASAAHVYADTVTPAADVATHVVIRASASSQSAAVGSLQPGQQLELVGSVPFWHEVRLVAGNGSIARS